MAAISISFFEAIFFIIFVVSEGLSLLGFKPPNY